MRELHELPSTEIVKSRDYLIRSCSSLFPLNPTLGILQLMSCHKTSKVKLQTQK